MRLSKSTFSAGDVSAIVRQALLEMHGEFERRKLCLDLDIVPLQANIDRDVCYSACVSLIRHAVGNSPAGGEISITLIDGNYQWELEVATARENQSATESSLTSTPESAQELELPLLKPHIIDHHLVNAHRQALEQGGQIQTWDCPQGGTANVLVVPKRVPSSSGDRAIA